MKKITHTYSNPKQAVLPILIQDYLDICDPVLTFDRFMGEIDLEKYLKDHEVPSYRTFGYFINEILSDSIEKLFYDINQKIFEKEHTDLQHLYIDGSKFEANANKYSWVWKKATEKSRYRLFEKITSLFQEINLELQSRG